MAGSGAYSIGGFTGPHADRIGLADTKDTLSAP
jgi:hypothetical protein